MKFVLLLIAMTIAMPVLVVELDLWRFKIAKRLGLNTAESSTFHPKHTFTSAMILLVLLFGWGFIVNRVGISEGWALGVFGTGAMLWAPYVEHRTRHI